jgi:polyhydroxybutyrate depolymerase
MDQRPNSVLTKRIVAVVCLLVTLSACTLRTNKDLEKTTGQVVYADHVREYVLLTPADLDDEETYPLILSLHGGGGDGKRMCSLRGGIQELAAEAEFIVLCPSGLERHWNDGRDIDRWRAHAEDIDDVGFLLDLIEKIIARYPVDRSQLFVTGMSNGGKMSLRLACEASGIFRAAAPVIASFPADLNCEPVDPISIMILNGTEDPLVPWEGGEVMGFGQPLGEALSTPETVSFWVEKNQCASEPDVITVPDRDPKDQSSIRVDLYTNCKDSEQVALYTVEGGGHTWPGGVQYLPKSLIGRTNRDAHAGRMIWEFFQQVAY